jgi:hypothetical protein
MLSLYRSQATAFDLLIRSFIRTNELFATIPLLALGTAPPGDAARPLELEPVGDLAYLRRQPGADIAAVEAAATGAEVVLRVHLAQTPAARTTTSVLIAVPLTSAHHLQALQVDCTPGQPATLTAATSHWRLGAGDLGGVTALVAGNTVRVVIPLPAFDGCDRFSVTAVTVTGSRVRDHSMARTYHLPHQQAP